MDHRYLESWLHCAINCDGSASVDEHRHADRVKEQQSHRTICRQEQSLCQDYPEADRRRQQSRLPSRPSCINYSNIELLWHRDTGGHQGGLEDDAGLGPRGENFPL